MNDILRNARIVEIFTQERDRLYFFIPANNLPHRHLILSALPNLPFISIREEHRKAKKNVISFYESFLPLEILDISIAEKDRIVKLATNKGDFFFTVRGVRSNIFFISHEGEIFPFKKPTENEKELSADFAELQFSNDLFVLSTVVKNELNETELKKEYPFFSKIIFRELKLRSSNPDSFEIEVIGNLFSDVLSGDIAVFFDKTENKVSFIPVAFRFADETEYMKRFSNYSDALRYFISLKFKTERISNLRKNIERILTKELKALANKLNNLKSRVDKGSRENEYSTKGTLLLNNLRLLQKGMKKIVLQDYISGKDILILLDEKLSPSQNAEKYFEKAKGEKKNFEASLKLFNNTKAAYEKYKALSEVFERTKDVNELENIYSGIARKEKKKIMYKEENIKYRHFLIEEKYHVFVGRDGRSNDLLSTKFAKQNDYWFHARGLPGSHVVLRVDNTKETIPKSVLKKAASIAAYFSKAKTAKVAPVSYTFAKFVYKRKGMEPGKVMLKKENVLLVTPEIPKDCEQIDE